MGLFGKIAGSYVKERVSNTKSALQLIIEDFKRYIIILKYIFLAFSVATLIYSIVAGIGTLGVDIALLAVLVFYSIFDAILKYKEFNNLSKKARIIYGWIKIALNAAALASSIYTIYAATSADQIKPYSIVLATLSIIMFILKVLVEICLDVFASKWRLLKTAMILDAVEHPNSSGKVFSPLIGEVIDESELKESDVERIKNNKN